MADNDNKFIKALTALLDGNRKLIAGFMFVVLAALIDRLGGGLSSNLKDFMQVVAAGFFAGNGVEHVAGAMAARAEPAPAPAEPAPTPEASPEMLAELQAQRAALSQVAESVSVVQKGLSFIISKAGFDKA